MKIKKNISSPATSLSSLNDTKLINLFSLFSPKDATLLGATCKKLHNIKNNLFERDYTKFDSCQEIRVVLEDNFCSRSNLKFLPNGNLVVTNHIQGFYLLDRNFNLIKKVFTGTLLYVETCGNSVVVGLHNGSLGVWNGQTGEAEYEHCFNTSYGEFSFIRSIASLTNHLFVCVQSNYDNDYMYLFNLQEKTPKLLLKDKRFSFLELGFLTSNSFVGITTGGNVAIFELQSDQSIKETKLQLYGNRIPSGSAYILRLNKELFLICDAAGNINVLSLNERKFLYKFPTNQRWVSGLIRLSNNYFATISEGDILKIWDVNKKKCINFLPKSFPIDKYKENTTGVAKLWNGDFITCNVNGNLVKWMFEPLENVKKNESTFQKMCCHIS